MDFCYFEREYEVYSEVEGLQKAINGYTLSEDNHISRNYRGKISNKQKYQDDESNRNKVKQRIPIEVQEYLLSPECLKSWAHYTLYEKC